ncbi:MAG: carbonic anhydrase [Gallionella sp.]|nr:carbonic anhydrase [Gallionella sp.]MDD4945338.1 carbonic anhydrase [Gallionella sp.]MDD5611761.1 carbonic anhydrase [Gallionella sp.]
MSLPQQLLAGFSRFRENHNPRTEAMFSRLFVEGQKPKFLIVGCCDSRVDPAIIFDCSPGELFVIRNVANLVPPNEERVGHHGTTAALEYGVRNLGVEHIVVLGHEHCGGIQTLMQGGVNNPDSFIDDWMRLVDSARLSVENDYADATAEEQLRACEQRAILVSLANLLTFPWIAQRAAEGTLQLHGWYLDIKHSQLLGHNPDTDSFEPL